MKKILLVVVLCAFFAEQLAASTGNPGYYCYSKVGISDYIDYLPLAEYAHKAHSA